MSLSFFSQRYGYAGLVRHYNDSIMIWYAFLGRGARTPGITIRPKSPTDERKPAETPITSKQTWPRLHPSTAVSRTQRSWECLETDAYVCRGAKKPPPSSGTEREENKNPHLLFRNHHNSMVLFLLLLLLLLLFPLASFRFGKYTVPPPMCQP